MKKVVFFVILFCGFLEISIAQEIDYKSNYRLLLGINISECDDNGENPKETQVFARKGFVFNIEGKNEKNLIISFLEWKVTSDVSTLNEMNTQNNSTFYSNNLRKGNQSEKKYFLLSDDIFEDKSLVEKVIGGGFTFGSLTIPIKARFGDNRSNLTNSKRYADFEGNINLGAAVGFKLKPSKRGTVQNFIGGLSLTQIPLDAINTNYFLKDSTLKINGSGISFYASYLVELNGFQFGAFLGRDYLGKEIGTKWIYNNKTWFGIGIGINIFKNETKQITQ